MRIDVMQGSLQDFELASVLQVVGLGRQYTGVELHTETGRLGVVYVKSGKVVQVEAGELTGKRALLELFSLSKGAFHVFRADTPPQLPEPMGALDQVLMSLHSDSGHPESMAPARAQTVAPKEPEAPARPAISQRMPAVTSPKTSGPFVIAVASPKGGCGKSTISLNLSLSLARRGHSVMLIDSDVNGDVLSALNAREKVKVGALDVIHEGLHLRDAVMNTVLSQFKLVPAVGKELPPLDVLDADHTERWRELLGEASKQADIVVVDTPAGMLGTTRQVLASCTHVLGVLQAEAIAERSFQRFTQALERLPGPQLLGVVLNMLQTRHGVSLSVLQSACASEIGRSLFDTTIPRHPAFLDAAATGSPLRRLDDNAPPAVAFLFDNLASEVAERLGLASTTQSSQSLLL